MDKIDYNKLLDKVCNELNNLYEQDLIEWLNNKDNDYIYKNIDHKKQCFKDLLAFFLGKEMYESASVVKKEIEKL